MFQSTRFMQTNKVVHSTKEKDELTSGYHQYLIKTTIQHGLLQGFPILYTLFVSQTDIKKFVLTSQSKNIIIQKMLPYLENIPLEPSTPILLAHGALIPIPCIELIQEFLSYYKSFKIQQSMDEEDEVTDEKDELTKQIKNFKIQQSMDEEVTDKEDELTKQIKDFKIQQSKDKEVTDKENKVIIKLEFNYFDRLYQVKLLLKKGMLPEKIEDKNGCFTLTQETLKEHSLYLADQILSTSSAVSFSEKLKEMYKKLEAMKEEKEARKSENSKITN